MNAKGRGRKDQATSIDPALDWPLLAALGVAILGVISLFLPGVVAPGEEPAIAIHEIDGLMAFGLLSLTAFLSFVSLFITKAWAGIAAGALAMISGSFAALVWMLAHPGPERAAQSGIGLILLLISGLALVCLGIIILFFRRER